ncbi:unnamed protein product [Caretta caretta]
MTVTETTLTEPPTLSAEERLKRKELRREELYRQYFEEIKRRFDSERLVDCSVIVVNKQTKEYAESVGRKVRDLGMVVDLIFLNTEMSLTQALERRRQKRVSFCHCHHTAAPSSPLLHC